MAFFCGLGANLSYVSATMDYIDLCSLSKCSLNNMTLLCPAIVPREQEAEPNWSKTDVAVTSLLVVVVTLG
jgi:hypothetical protein